ncbi:phosphorylase [Candidatus Methylocalor cossyra]|uniref:5'-methylthioadenosine nucleosidase n=1 Tax=Candidatus Methylocalor cossyra TaxID=3108543 RepID=A0ABM9NFG8_9GAMM
MPQEARSLGARGARTGLARLPDGHWLAVSGAGPELAQSAARRLLAEGVTALVSWGCAAALAPTLRPGQVVIPERVLGADGSPWAVHGPWRDRLRDALAARLPVVSGGLLESVAIIAEPSHKQALYAQSGCLVLDMESAAVARVAAAAGVPFLALRAVADSAAMALPPAVVRALDRRGTVRPGAFLGQLLRHPGQLLPVLQLGLAFSAANTSLRRARELAGPGCGLGRFP